MAKIVIPLYLCKSFEDLLENVRFKCKHLGSSSAKMLVERAEQVYAEAIKAEEAGDEELAFSFYHEHATALRFAIEKDEICRDNPIHQNKLEHSVKAFSLLEVSLRRRYEQLQSHGKGNLPKEEPTATATTSTSPEEKEEVEDDDENNCPICVSIPSGKIFQCREGHVVCESCLGKIQEAAQRADTFPSCPSCAGHLDNDTVSRVRVLEKMLDRLTIDCCYKKNGCSVQLKRDAISTHESSCLYGRNLIGICKMFGDPSCSFKLSVRTANDVFQHIKSNHPSWKFQGHRFCEIWGLKGVYDAVSEIGSPHSSMIFPIIAQVPVPGSQEYVLLMAKVSKHCVSFYSIDLSLRLSGVNKPRVTFSIAKDAEVLMSWTIAIARGIQSWEFLSDEECQKPIEIVIQSLLQHCDDNGKLKIDFVVEVE